MRELIDERTAHLLMNALALGLPVAGGVVGALVGAARGRVAASTRAGLGIGALGIVNWLLWRLYNAITNHYGLDTVKNLLVNLAVFVGIGALAGVVVGLRLRAAAGTREPAAETRET
jgi:hypothetical protein